jgi:hypothetical protein
MFLSDLIYARSQIDPGWNDHKDTQLSTVSMIEIYFKFSLRENINSHEIFFAVTSLGITDCSVFLEDIPVWVIVQTC